MQRGFACSSRLATCLNSVVAAGLRILNGQAGRGGLQQGTGRESVDAPSPTARQPFIEDGHDSVCPLTISARPARFSTISPRDLSLRPALLAAGAQHFRQLEISDLGGRPRPPASPIQAVGKAGDGCVPGTIRGVRNAASGRGRTAGCRPIRVPVRKRPCRERARRGASFRRAQG